MTTPAPAPAPRTCTRCGRHYSVKPGHAKYTTHRYGVCPICRPPKAANRGEIRDYSHIAPIADDQDDTRPVWSYRKPTGVLMLLPGDLDTLNRRLTDYWARRLGMRMLVCLDLDDDMQPTGAGYVIGPETGKIRARFRLERIRP